MTGPSWHAPQSHLLRFGTTGGLGIPRLQSKGTCFLPPRWSIRWSTVNPNRMRIGSTVDRFGVSVSTRTRPCRTAKRPGVVDWGDEVRAAVRPGSDRLCLGVLGHGVFGGYRWDPCRVVERWVNDPVRSPVRHIVRRLLGDQSHVDSKPLHIKRLVQSKWGGFNTRSLYMPPQTLHGTAIGLLWNSVWDHCV